MVGFVSVLMKYRMDLCDNYALAPGFALLEGLNRGVCLRGTKDGISKGGFCRSTQHRARGCDVQTLAQDGEQGQILHYNSISEKYQLYYICHTVALSPKHNAIHKTISSHTQAIISNIQYQIHQSNDPHRTSPPYTL